MEEILKEAEELYEQEKYDEAFKLFEQCSE